MWPLGQTKGAPTGARLVWSRRMGSTWSEEWIVGVTLRSRLIGWGILYARLLEQLGAVMIPDHFPEFVEEFEDCESLFWGPVSGKGEGDCEERAG